MIGKPLHRVGIERFDYEIAPVPFQKRHNQFFHEKLRRFITVFFDFDHQTRSAFAKA